MVSKNFPALIVSTASWLVMPIFMLLLIVVVANKILSVGISIPFVEAQFVTYGITPCEARSAARESSFSSVVLQALRPNPRIRTEKSKHDRVLLGFGIKIIRPTLFPPLAIVHQKYPAHELHHCAFKWMINDVTLSCSKSKLMPSEGNH